MGLSSCSALRSYVSMIVVSTARGKDRTFKTCPHGEGRGRVTVTLSGCSLL